MKAKKQLDPLDALLGQDSVLRNSILNPSRIEDSRKSALTTHIDNIVVDTVKPVDTGVWETGIQRGSWIIVEQYDDEQQARTGHDAWVEKIKKDPNTPLEDIHIFGE